MRIRYGKLELAYAIGIWDVRTHEGMPRRNITGCTTTNIFNGVARTTRICRKQIFRSSHAFYTRKSTQLYKKVNKSIWKKQLWNECPAYEK